MTGKPAPMDDNGRETTHTLIEMTARLIQDHGQTITASDLRECKRAVPNVPITPSLAALREREPATDAVRDQALEDAAKICDRKATESSVEMFGVAMRLAATAIRALKGKGASLLREPVLGSVEKPSPSRPNKPMDFRSYEKALSAAPEAPAKEQPGELNARRVKCPDCPDGQLWDKDGPTSDACLTCGARPLSGSRHPNRSAHERALLGKAELRAS